MRNKHHFWRFKFKKKKKRNVVLSCFEVGWGGTNFCTHSANTVVFLDHSFYMWILFPGYVTDLLLYIERYIRYLKMYLKHSLPRMPLG